MMKAIPIFIQFVVAGLWVVALFDVAFSRFRSGWANLIWLIIVVLMPGIGALTYLTLRKIFHRRKRKFAPKFN